MTTELQGMGLQQKKVWENLLNNNYTLEQKEGFSKTIKTFNELYYSMGKQTWLGMKWRGITVYKPATDMWIYQELITQLRPDLIIETGTHVGGSALFMHDIMRLEEIDGLVMTIDIDDHRDKKFKDMCENGYIKFIHGNSVDDLVLDEIHEYINEDCPKTVMVILDSDHTKEHVFRELELYTPFVTVGSALIVEDTSNTDGAKEAVEEWHALNLSRFSPDYMCEKFMLTFNRGGYFERIK
jgi:cephalosporin hydroxylase